MPGSWRRRLRPRIILSHVIVVLVTTALYAVSVVVLKERLERSAYESLLRSQLDAALKAPDPDSYFDSPSLHRWSLYRAGALLFLPDAVRELAPGSYHSVAFDDRVWHLEVAMRAPTTAGGQAPETAAQKMILAYDITEWELAEHTMLRWMLLGALLAVLLALVLGWVANAAIVAPVISLRRCVQALDPQYDELRLGPHFEGSEVGPIAKAIDDLLERIRTLIARERSFTSAASHELRSSLAVMQGALEVLDARQPALADDAAVIRLHRAAEEMNQFVEAALFLARDDASGIDEVGLRDMAAVADTVARRYREEAQAAGVQLHLDLSRPVQLAVPSIIAYIAVANLVRNALQHSHGSDLFLSVDEHAVLVADNGQGIPPELLQNVTRPHVSGELGGSGLGLSLVHRICERFDWTLRIDSAPGEGVRVTLAFPRSEGTLA